MGSVGEPSSRHRSGLCSVSKMAPSCDSVWMTFLNGHTAIRLIPSKLSGSRDDKLNFRLCFIETYTLFWLGIQAALFGRFCKKKKKFNNFGVFLKKLNNSSQGNYFGTVCTLLWLRRDHLPSCSSSLRQPIISTSTTDSRYLVRFHLFMTVQMRTSREYCAAIIAISVHLSFLCFAKASVKPVLNIFAAHGIAETNTQRFDHSYFGVTIIICDTFI